jgi:spore germination protein GerM
MRRLVTANARRRAVGTTALLLGLSVLTACGSSSSPEAASTTTAAPTTGAASSTSASSTTVGGATTTTVAATRTLRVYFVRGETLAVAHRTVAATAPPARAALDALLAGPETADGGMTTAVPTGTKALGVSIGGGIATVDLTRTFESGGGSLSMFNRIAQVVYTMTQFPTVQRVAFRLGGQAVESIGGEGIIVDPPTSRADYYGQLPPILVEEPAIGDTVSSPLVVSGSSDVFEAVMQFRIRDADGRVLVRAQDNATSGTGTRGTFRTTLRFSATTDTGTLEVYDVSMKDGSEIDLQSIPLRFHNAP